MGVRYRTQLEDREKDFTELTDLKQVQVSLYYRVAKAKSINPSLQNEEQWNEKHFPHSGYSFPMVGKHFPLTSYLLPIVGKHFP